MLYSTTQPPKRKTPVRGQLENLIWIDIKFESKLALSTFSKIWFYTKLSTSVLTNVLRILTAEAPVAHQPARHSQRRSAELTCSSTYKPTIVHARFVQHNLAANIRRPYPLSTCRERLGGDSTQGGDSLGGNSTQQVSYKATTLTWNSQETSVMQQLPLAHPVCRRNRIEASWHLQRTR